MEDLLQTPPRVLRNKHLDNVQNFSTPLQIPPSPFLSTLGHGTGVSVYRLDRSPLCGQLRSPWAIKRVTKRSRTDKNGKLFNQRILKEADILRQLNHPNIVGYRGVVKLLKGFGGVALECCTTSLGDILEKRHDEKSGALPAKQCIEMIFDISKALDYLHTEAMILHCDVKSFNILIKGDFEICKLCDFGVSLPLDENGEINFNENPQYTYVGTQLWSAPETLEATDIIDSKADIYSFGLTIYETLALVPPHMLSLREEAENKENSKELVDTSMQTIPEPNELSGNCDKENKDESNAEEGEARGGISDESDDEEEPFTDMFQTLGTRPLLPMEFILTEEYNLVVELFYYCTNLCSEDRPSAKTIWQSIKNMKITQTKKNKTASDDDDDDTEEKLFIKL